MAKSATETKSEGVMAEMLSALKTVEDYCTRGGDLEAMLEVVRAAIAKAERAGP